MVVNVLSAVLMKTLNLTISFLFQKEEQIPTETYNYFAKIVTGLKAIKLVNPYFALFVIAYCSNRKTIMSNRLVKY